jgi:hypothetical protein
MFTLKVHPALAERWAGDGPSNFRLGSEPSLTRATS